MAAILTATIPVIMGMGRKGAALRAPIRVDRPAIVNRAPAAANRDWYRIVNATDGDTAEVWVYDEIGWDVESGPFARDLAALTARHITVRMNTPGGSVFDGLAIYNALLSHPAKVTVQVDGLAASAGSFIAQAGDEVIMGRNAQMMIHDAAGLAIGNANDMRDMADLLDKVSDNIASIYHDRAGGTVAAWRERMRDETWYSAEEAVKAGLADGMAPAPKRRGDDDDEGMPHEDEDMPMDPDEDHEDEDEDEKVAALLKPHDLTGRYRYDGRSAAPDPVPVPTEPAAMIPGIPGERGKETVAIPAGATITLGGTSTTGASGTTITVTYTGATAEPAAEPAEPAEDGAAPETPDPGSPAPTPDPDPEPTETGDDGDADGDGETRDDPAPTAHWADLTARITTPPDTWAHLTGRLTQHHSTTEPSITDLLARLRHKEPTA